MKTLSYEEAAFRIECARWGMRKAEEKTDCVKMKKQSDGVRQLKSWYDDGDMMLAGVRNGLGWSRRNCESLLGMSERKWNFWIISCWSIVQVGDVCERKRFLLVWGGLIFWAFEILNCNVFVVFSENYFMNRREFSFCRVPSHREHRRPYIQTSRNGNCYVIVTHYSKCLLLLFLVVILVATTTTIRPAPRRRWREVVYREDRIVWRKGNPKIILIECHQWMKAINNSNRCRCAFHNPSNR